MKALGTHLLLELKSCNVEYLDDLPLIQETLIFAAHSTGATIFGHTFHKFSPQGVTGVVAIAESHVCIHTWPEYEYAAADIFTCGEGFDPKKAADVLVQKLQAKDATVTDVQRVIFEKSPISVS